MDIDDDDFEYPPQILADHRLVYGDYLPPGGWTERHKKLKKDFQENPGVFLARLASLERVWAQREAARMRTLPVKVKKGEVVEVEDRGSERAMELLDDLLARHAGGLNERGV